MAFKRINYNESLKYYLKDYLEYERKECHVNTFQKFFNNNYEEVENNEKAFKYVIGLLINNSADNTVCYIHSWIEKNNSVIDVTPFANVYISSSEQLVGDEYEEFARQVNESRYMPLKTVSNANLNKEFNNLLRSGGDLQNPGKTMEKLIRQWIEEAEKDPRIPEVVRKNGLKLIDN